MHNSDSFKMQVNHMYELQKQINASPNQFPMHAQLIGANPQHQAILNQQHLINQQLAQQHHASLSPMFAPLKRGRKANEDTDRKRRKKDPNRPKRAMTPYFFFTAEYRNSLRREGKAVPGVKEVAQYCGPKWNSMTDTEKEPYIKLAEDDRKRYLSEMNVYKKPRDEDKPKRPASAYFHFLVEFRKKMAGKPLPEHTTIPKLSGALWQKMTEEERKPYNDKMEEEKKVYERRLSEYRKMKAEEALKNAKKRDDGSSYNAADGFRNSYDITSGLTQYNDINRHIQMTTNKSGQLTWQNQSMSGAGTAAASAASSHMSYNYSSLIGGNNVYSSPGTSHSDKLNDNGAHHPSLPSITSLQTSMQLQGQALSEQLNSLQQKQQLPGEGGQQAGSQQHLGTPDKQTE